MKLARVQCEPGAQKKPRSGQCGVPRRELKRPYNHPLSTDGCNCQASEEERLSVKRCGTSRIDGYTLATQPYMKLTLKMFGEVRV